MCFFVANPFLVPRALQQRAKIRNQLVRRDELAIDTPPNDLPFIINQEVIALLGLWRGRIGGVILLPDIQGTIAHKCQGFLRNRFSVGSLRSDTILECALGAGQIRGNTKQLDVQRSDLLVELAGFGEFLPPADT